MTDVFERSKHTGGQFPSLVVLDEAQYYAPKQQTGWLPRSTVFRRRVYDRL